MLRIRELVNETSFVFMSFKMSVRNIHSMDFENFEFLKGDFSL